MYSDLNNLADGQAALLSTISTDDFLMRTGELLHKHGTPSHRLERVMTKVARTLGITCTFLYTPTSLIASIGESPNERMYMRRVDSGSVDADKLIWFDEILEDLEANKIGVTQARERLEAAASALAPYSPGLTAMVCGFACASLSYWVAESRTLLQPRIFCCHSTQTHTTTYLGSAAPFLTDYGARSIFHSLPLERDPR